LSPIVMNDGALNVCWNIEGPVPVCASRYNPGLSSSFFGIAAGCFLDGDLWLYSDGKLLLVSHFLLVFPCAEAERNVGTARSSR
jgi:hypothetical protein